LKLTPNREAVEYELTQALLQVVFSYHFSADFTSGLIHIQPLRGWGHD
jgi:hypothetical protein